MTRFWLYKNNRDGGPAGYGGDWSSDVFDQSSALRWGGTHSTLSPEVWNYLDSEVASGDVIVAYQTDQKAVVGFCVVTKVVGDPGERDIYLTPVERLPTPFLIHRHKIRTPLESSTAVNGPVMMRELSRTEMETLVSLCGAPARVIQGKAAAAGYRP